jgi:hypothetical protein
MQHGGNLRGATNRPGGHMKKYAYKNHSVCFKPSPLPNPACENSNAIMLITPQG